MIGSLGLVGAEMDPSHLFWQGIDPVRGPSTGWLGPLVLHAAAKDTRVNPNCSIYGVLDDRFTRIPLEQNPTGLGGRHVVNRWPEDSAWDFVAVGQEHGVGFWSDFLRALERVDPGISGGHRTRGPFLRAVGRSSRRRRNPEDCRRDAEFGDDRRCAGQLSAAGLRWSIAPPAAAPARRRPARFGPARGTRRPSPPSGRRWSRRPGGWWSDRSEELSESLLSS